MISEEDEAQDGDGHEDASDEDVEKRDVVGPSLARCVGEVNDEDDDSDADMERVHCYVCEYVAEDQEALTAHIVKMHVFDAPPN